MLVSRDIEATVEFDGDEFCIVLRWLEEIGFAHRHRAEHHISVDEADLPREMVRDLKDVYADRYGETDDEEDHKE